MNKIKTAAIVLAIIIVISAVAAGVYYYMRSSNLLTDKQAQDILSELIPKAEKLSPIIWGDPLYIEGDSPLEDLPTYSADIYKKADTAAYGYSSTDELRNAIKEVYCESYANDELEIMLFKGSSDEIADIYPKFKMNTADELLVNADYYGFKVGTKVDVGSAKVKGYKEHFNFRMIDVEVNAVLPNGDDAPLTLTLYKQGENEWRLYNPLY